MLIYVGVGWGVVGLSGCTVNGEKHHLSLNLLLSPPPIRPAPTHTHTRMLISSV